MKKAHNVYMGLKGMNRSEDGGTLKPLLFSPAVQLPSVQEVHFFFGLFYVASHKV